MMMDLSRFCDPTSSREITRPWSVGDWTFATNGHIAVRTPRRDDVPENQNAPDAEKLFGMVPRAGLFRPLPAIEIPKPKEDEACIRCNGRGNAHDCPTCNCVCTNCGGTGLKSESASIGLGPAVFDARYIAMLQKLPNIEIFVSKETEPMPFRFDGGDGLLMPMRGPQANHIVAELKD